MSTRLLISAALLAGCAASADVNPPSIVLVSLDTLRADRLGSYGNPDALTPNLDRFASEAVLFEHAYSQATTTAPSHASLFTSRYPSELDDDDRRPAYSAATPTLAQVLGAYGWESAAFVGGGELAPELGVGLGFGEWNSPKDFGSLWHTTPPALAWLSEHDGSKPWLLFVHGYDAHVPYLKPAPFGYVRADAHATGPGAQAAIGATERVVDGWYHPDARALAASAEDEARPRSPAARARLLEAARARGDNLQRLSEKDVAQIRGVYDGAVAYGDAWFGLLMEGLQDRGVLDRAVVVVVSDHGEQLGEDGMFQHCCGVGDEETHVPLMVRMPHGEGGGRRVSGLVELVDVMPTLLELVGASAPAGVHGRSFAAALRGEPFSGRDVAYSMGGLGHRMLGARTATGRLVYSGAPMSSALAPELVETASLPGPSFTAIAMPDAEQATVRAGMATWLASLSPAPAAAREALPDALRAELRAHGYFEVAP